MDLHTVADIVEEHAIEAHTAVHAGHPETTYEYFKTIMEQIRTFFNEMSPAEVAALAETTSEKPKETLPETPAQAPGAQVRPAEEGSVLPASQFGANRSVEMPYQ